MTEAGSVPVELVGRTFEAAPDAPADALPIVVLHGLYGSSRSWVAVARKLASGGPVHVLDLRNHGRSPHARPHDYRAMAADVLRYLDGSGLERVRLIGHSMGGKTAMRLASDVGERIADLSVLDIAPVDYVVGTEILDALLAVDLTKVRTRSDAEEQLLEAIPDRATRLFLLTNLARSGDGYRWSIPLEILKERPAAIFENPLDDDDRYLGPCQFIAGGDSDYITDEGFAAARRYFPNARLVVLAGVGHNVHTEGGDAFLSAVLSG